MIAEKCNTLTITFKDREISTLQQILKNTQLSESGLEDFEYTEAVNLKKDLLALLNSELGEV